MADAVKLRPLFLIKPGSVSRKDIRRAEKLSGICMIECGDPETARFCEPPMIEPMDAQSAAAMSLFRHVLQAPSADFKRSEMVRWFVDHLLKGSPPTPVTPVPVVRK